MPWHSRWRSFNQYSRVHATGLGKVTNHIQHINFVKTSTECCFSTWHCLYLCRLYHHCSNQQCNSVLNMWCFCAIWYNLYDLKNVKNTHGGMLLLVKLQAFSLYLLACSLLACAKHHIWLPNTFIISTAISVFLCIIFLYFVFINIIELMYTVRVGKIKFMAPDF